MRQLTGEKVARSMPSSPQLRTEPLTTAMFDWRSRYVTLTPSSEPRDTDQVEPVEVERDAAGGDLDAVLAGDAGDVAGEVVRAGLGDLEEAVGIAGRVGRVDRRCAARPR